MTLIESSVTIAPRVAGTSSPSRDGYRSVVLLFGDHDISTMSAVSETLARTIALDDADLVIDLSGVTFMGAETVGVLVRTQAFLRPRSRSLQLRAPSARAMRILHHCGLDALLEPPPTAFLRADGTDAARETWFTTAAGRGDRRGSSVTRLHSGQHRRTRVAFSPRRPPPLGGATIAAESSWRRVTTTSA